LKFPSPRLQNPHKTPRNCSVSWLWSQCRPSFPIVSSTPQIAQRFFCSCSCASKCAGPCLPKWYFLVFAHPLGESSYLLCTTFPLGEVWYFFLVATPLGEELYLLRMALLLSVILSPESFPRAERREYRSRPPQASKSIGVPRDRLGRSRKRSDRCQPGSELRCHSFSILRHRASCSSTNL